MKKVFPIIYLLFFLLESVQAVIRPTQQMFPALTPMRVSDATALICNSYESSNDGDGTAIVMYSNDGVWQVRFQFKDASLEDGKEYTYDDLVDYQSFIREDGTWNFYSYQAVTYKQWTEDNGSFHVRATATTTDGKEWDISYDKGATQPSGEVRVLTFDNKDVSLTDYIQMDETFQFCAKNSEAEIRITISSEQIEGDYGWEDYLPLYSGVYLFGADGDTTLVSFTDIHATVEPIEGKANAYTCDFEGVTADGTTYKTFLTYIPDDLEAVGEVDIVADNLQVLDFIEKEKQVIFNGSNDKYGVSITVYTDTLGGTWDMESVDGFWSDVCLYGEDGLPEAMYQITNCSITYEKSENGDELLSGWLLASNKIKYNLNITYKKPESTRSEDIVSEDARIKDLSADPNEQYVRIQGTSTDGKYFVSIMIDTDTPTGTFSLDDFDEDYTYVDLLGTDGFAEKSYALIDGNVEISLNDGVYTATGKLLMQYGDDVPEFNINIKALPQTGMDYDVESEAFSGEMTYVQTQEYDDEYGHYVLLVAANNATSPENMLYLQFMIDQADPNIMVPEGEYEINDSYETSTVVACSGVNNGSVLPSFVCNLTPEGQAVLPMWFLRSGKVTVSKNAAGEIHVVVDAKNSYGQPINVVVDQSIGTGIENVEQSTEKPKAVKRIVDGELVIEYNGNTYSVTGVKK